jgi:heptose-I-phosphate ethanolaminephosphotransferase
LKGDRIAQSRPRDTLIACGAIAATITLLVTLGHEGRRVAQLLALAAPVLLWLLWPIRSASGHRLRTGVVWVWAFAFAVDGAARAYLLGAYHAAPDSALILGAAANTNAREGSEYLSMNWRSLAVWLAVLVAVGWVVGRFASRGIRAPAEWPRWATALMCATLVVSSIAYASKPWRRLHPIDFWAHWSDSVHAQRASWSDQLLERQRALARAKAAAPVVMRDGPATVMLVITDSVNRDNMALYGYGRATTPQLLAQQAQLDGQMLVLRNAWSVDASTLPALRNMFSFGLPASDNPQHVLALARAAGYKVWWVSNHDDVAIEQQHARLADVVDMVNRTPGRASASLDGELLDCVQEALADPAERKLIVVHLLGAHPHYTLRFPAGSNPFDDGADAVEEGLLKSGRSAWVRQFRQEYDAAILYHDFVVSELLQMARRDGRTHEHRAWMYLSDHGQEVGHVSDRAGHSPSTESGYRIPAVVWHNEVRGRTRQKSANLPFRSDWLGWTISDLLNLQWAGDEPSRNVLHDDYRWRAPSLPVAVRSFEE